MSRLLKHRHKEQAQDAEEYGPAPEVERRAPDSPTELPKTLLVGGAEGTVKEFKKDELTDRAAALTYYGDPGAVPGAAGPVSLLGIVGSRRRDAVLDNIQQLAPGRRTRRHHATRCGRLQDNAGIGSVMAIVGLVLAVWSASGYVAAFIRTANAVYDIPEGRPVWKVLPVRLGVTVVLMVLAVVSALIVVFTGGLARQVGTRAGHRRHGADRVVDRQVAGAGRCWSRS